MVQNCANKGQKEIPRLEFPSYYAAAVQSCSYLQNSHEIWFVSMTKHVKVFLADMLATLNILKAF